MPGRSRYQESSAHEGEMMSGGEQVQANLTRWSTRKLAGLYSLCDDIGKSIFEAEAKTNAPWTDRTGNARQGLSGGAEIDGDSIVIYVAHSMEYGIYLELSNAGKYAILKPTIERNLERIRKVLTEYWESPE